MSAVLLKILQLIVALSVLILVHEAGHFSFAKLFKIRVDKFFLFFDIGGKALLSTKHGWFAKLFPRFMDKETEYGIGWLPLGGYCKIAGMVDESMDTESLKGEPQPWEFRTKKAWQRLLVMAGGVLYNFIFAILLYIAALQIWGTSYISNEENRIFAGELAREMGFRTGDRILALDDYIPTDFSSIQADIARRNVSVATVERDGDTVQVYIDHSYMPRLISERDVFDLAVPFVVDTIPPASPNYGAGYRKGDHIIAVDSLIITYLQDSRGIFSGKPNSELTATVVRGADTLMLPIRTDSTSRALIYAHIPGIYTKEYGFFESIPAGVELTFSTIGSYLRDIKMVMSPSTGAYKSVGSFITIADAMPSSWNWQIFVHLLGLLSIMLGVMNLLPIPALDGGHIVFVIYEMITGRKPSDKFMEVAQMIGMVLILALMLFACGNDIGRLIR
ncbi:MAG: RIP metalloprotease RseP [Bacteroidales bacterium]|nr:RIP metalloprotease RseP [Bacteroidales bacterium]